jgi:hypothetical protein
MFRAVGQLDSVFPQRAHGLAQQMSAAAHMQFGVVACAADPVDFIGHYDLQTRPGAHIHFRGKRDLKRIALIDWGSQYHPNEHVLSMSKRDLLELPNTLAHFNGINTRRGETVMLNQTNVLVIAAVAVASLLNYVGSALRRFADDIHRLNTHFVLSW